jgi:hypothetical protein
MLGRKVAPGNLSDRASQQLLEEHELLREKWGLQNQQKTPWTCRVVKVLVVATHHQVLDDIAETEGQLGLPVCDQAIVLSKGE